MTPRHKLVAGVLATLLTTAALAVVLDQRDPARTFYRGSVPQARITLPDFSLHDQDGTPITRRSLTGKVAIVTFLDTDCEESCPVIASVIGAAIPRLSPAERERVAAFAFTVNPTTDSPERADRFLRDHRARGSLDFLLGTIDELQPTWQALMILSAHESGNPDIHSAPVRIYDENGVWVSTLHAGADLTAANLIHDLRQALRPTCCA